LIPVPPETDRGQNNETCGRRVSRERMLLRKELDSVVQKTSKKVKKSLSGFGKLTKRGKVGRQTSRLSVQKYLKKVKKKLVRLKKIQ
jgi:ribosomal protein S30